MIPLSAVAGQACTQMGCTNGLILSVDPDYDWKNGVYVFDFFLDGKNVKCNGMLPLQPCERGPSISCNKEGVMITESGCALAKSAHAFGDIVIEGSPKRVLARITRNGKPVVTRTLVPRYETLRPNGPSCGPVCQTASHDLFQAK
jgi:hypothetical protein